VHYMRAEDYFQLVDNPPSTQRNTQTGEFAE
jgi:hypothetical protein